MWLLMSVADQTSVSSWDHASPRMRYQRDSLASWVALGLACAYIAVCNYAQQTRAYLLCSILLHFAQRPHKPSFALV